MDPEAQISSIHDVLNAMVWQPPNNKQQQQRQHEASSESCSTPSCRPWSISDYLSRVASFLPYPSHWLAKPLSLSPHIVSLYGWICYSEQPDTLTCMMCHKHLIITYHIRLTTTGRDEITKHYVQQLSKAHDTMCPWYDQHCDLEMSRISTIEHDLIQQYHSRYNTWKYSPHIPILMDQHVRTQVVAHKGDDTLLMSVSLLSLSGWSYDDAHISCSMRCRDIPMTSVQHMSNPSYICETQVTSNDTETSPTSATTSRKRPHDDDHDTVHDDRDKRIRDASTIVDPDGDDMEMVSGEGDGDGGDRSIPSTTSVEEQRWHHVSGNEDLDQKVETSIEPDTTTDTHLPPITLHPFDLITSHRSHCPYLLQDEKKDGIDIAWQRVIHVVCQDQNQPSQEQQWTGDQQLKSTLSSVRQLLLRRDPL